MFEGYRVVAVTPAGRRRYMELLVPQILSSPLVDRYDIWVNTANRADKAFLEGLAATYDRVRLVPQPDGKAPGVKAIHGFHRMAQDEDTIYIRFDDDVVWMEPGFFETLLRFRLDHPQHFLVMPLIINNALCSNLLQSIRKILIWRHVHTNCFDQIGWNHPEFAIALHRFLLGLIGRNETHRLHDGAHQIALSRFSINCICWFGRDLAAFDGVVAEEEEEELSAAIPVRLKRSNAFCTDTIAAHFAFYTQRAQVDRSGILDAYTAVLAARPELARLSAEVREIRKAAEARYPGIEEVEGGVVLKRRPQRWPLWLQWRRLLTSKRRFKKPKPPIYVKPGPAL